MDAFEEFEGHGGRHLRGRPGQFEGITDEHIEMFKALCTGYPASYSGRHFAIDDKVFYPKPIQQPHPPVWIGGVSRAAVRRAARVGDGWLPNGMSPGDVEEARRRLHAACDSAGRNARRRRHGRERVAAVRNGR